MANSSQRSTNTHHRSVSPSITPRRSGYYHSYNHHTYAHLNGTPVADSIVVARSRRRDQPFDPPLRVEYDNHTRDSSEWTPRYSPLSALSSSSSFHSSLDDSTILPEDSISDYEPQNTSESHISHERSRSISPGPVIPRRQGSYSASSPQSASPMSRNSSGSHHLTSHTSSSQASFSGHRSPSSSSVDSQLSAPPVVISVSSNGTVVAYINAPPAMPVIQHPSRVPSYRRRRDVTSFEGSQVSQPPPTPVVLNAHLYTIHPPSSPQTSPVVFQSFPPLPQTDRY